MEHSWVNHSKDKNKDIPNDNSIKRDTCMGLLEKVYRKAGVEFDLDEY